MTMSKDEKRQLQQQLWAIGIIELNGLLIYFADILVHTV